MSLDSGEIFVSLGLVAYTSYYQSGKFSKPKVKLQT